MDMVSSTGETPGETSAARRMIVDAEHLGIRLGVPILAGLALVGVLIGLPPLLRALHVSQNQLNLITFPVAVIAAVVVAYGSDRVIKVLWPSRRQLLLDEHQLVLRNKGEAEATLSWDGRINMLTWHFTVPRRGRVPKGHLCLGMQLVQDDALITVYSFLSPKRSEEVEGFEAFHSLLSRKALDKGGLSMRAIGEQRRLREAENERWEHGAELEIDDFLDLWAEVRRHGAAPQA
ncbi:MAG: hypothetical protein JW910_08990 [Anaerolineae bacterium]|nr:hypothetical protein [Anaerolineae bacterium]